MKMFAPDLHRVAQALRVNHILFNGTPMTELEISQGITQYRQFAATHKLQGMPDRFEVPSLLVDRVWHTHMTENEQYAKDCTEFFGKIIYHRSEICNGGGEWEITQAA